MCIEVYQSMAFSAANISAHTLMANLTIEICVMGCAENLRKNIIMTTLTGINLFLLSNRCSIKGEWWLFNQKESEVGKNKKTDKTGWD
jgi:hypothetical protein